MLLAVILSFGSAPDRRTGNKSRDSQNNSAVFSRISAISGTGDHSCGIVSDGETGWGKCMSFRVYFPCCSDRGKGKKGRSGHLHQSRPRFLSSHRSDRPCNLDKWILQWLPVLANLHDSGIINPEKPPDTVPGIRPEFPGDGY